jgi:hypothetical protein
MRGSDGPADVVDFENAGMVGSFGDNCCCGCCRYYQKPLNGISGRSLYLFKETTIHAV